MKKHLLSFFALAGLSLSAMAIDQVDDVYQINTPQDLVDFSAIVNGGNDRAAASLNVDLDMSSVENFTPIGLYSDNNFPGKKEIPYRGDFRGNGHVISHLNVVIADYEVGLFSRTASGANIHELGVVDSHFESTNGVRVGALGGEMHQTRVYACFGVNNEIVSSKGDDNKGGIAGEAAATNVNFCYTDYPRVAGSCGGKDLSREGVALEKIMSGELCFNLNNQHTYTPLWHQDLHNGGYPCVKGDLPEVTKLQDSDTYTNDHHFVDGVCTECVDFFYDKDYMSPDADGWYNISTPEQLMWFSVFTCHGHQNVKGRLTADIDMAGFDKFYGIGEYEKEGGENYPFLGQFNGQGHEVKNLTVYRDDPLESGFFGRARGAQISNIGFSGDITITNTQGIRCGVLGGELLDCNINNVYVCANSITYNTTHAQKGAFGGETVNSTFNRCYTTEATFNGGGGTFNNCFNNAGGDVDAMASTGELCALLGAGWYQNLDNDQPQDAFPVLDATHGEVNELCDGSGYTNGDGHPYDENGFCQNDPSHLQPMGWDAEKSAYTIANRAQLELFADEVNYNNQSANGSLVADIDLKGEEFTPIGLNNDNDWQRPFRGTFYGNGHVIKNLYAKTNCEGGLFSRLRTGSIYDLGIENAKIESTTGLRCGVIAGEHHDNAWMYNCFTVGTIEFVTSHDQKGGLAGEGHGGHFVNCYTVVPTLVCDLPAGGTMEHCFMGVTSEDLASGKLCYEIGGKFRQEIGADAYPVIDETKPAVKAAEVTSMGYATFVADEDVKFNATGLEAYVVAAADAYAELEQVDEVPAGEAVVLKADEGTYYFNTTTGVVAPTANELKYSDSDIEADGTQYVLAQPEGDKPGFYCVEGAATIPAGIVYLTSNSGETALYFEKHGTVDVQQLQGQQLQSNDIYNLAGQRISTLQRGVNIVNGKKVLK